MVNKNNFKKKISIFLATSIIFGCTIPCSAEAMKNEKGKIHVLENQQKEIDDVLIIRAIDKIEKFAAYAWLNNDEIIGKNRNNQVENICIYNCKKNEMISVTNNNDKNIEFSISGLSDITKQLNNDFIMIEEYNRLKRKTSRTWYSFNLKDHSFNKIEGIMGYASLINNNKLITTEGYKIYEYNLVTGEKNQIILPDEVNKKIKKVPSFNEYIDAVGLSPEERGDEHVINKYKGFYEYNKEDAGINANKNRNKLTLSTHYFKSYVYDLDTKTLVEDDNAFQTIYASELDAINIKGNGVIEIEETEGNSKIWQLNSNGERYKLIDEGNILHYEESLDHSKLVYSMIEDIEGQKFANEVKTYICDLNSGKKTVLQEFKDIDIGIFWNQSSNRLYFLESVSNRTSRTSFETKCITNIITFN
ncbi:MAG: hypothetical protein N4A68_03415 [Maledivibacter sp.]|jgi:hypothetical protein|nr:hypothetical protein [Maledivibacter sp.]